MYISDKVKSKIKLCAICTVVACVLAFAIFTVMRYEVEGEKKMPFKLGKIIVISSAVTVDSEEDVNEQSVENVDNTENVVSNENQESVEVEAENLSEIVPENSSEDLPEENYIWNEKVVQTNDLYIYIDKDKEFGKDSIIKSVKIENIQILQNVKLGKIQVYMPNSLDGGLYKYTNDFLINSTLTYYGASSDNVKGLEIGNQGGCVCLSFANIGVGEYKSNEDTEIVQGGSLLEKMQVSNEDLKFRVAFDLIIEVQDKSYKTNLVLDLPVEDLVGKKESHKEITDFSNVVFKRIQK